MNENTPLTFKPLNEGLGFKPFADGMPYAPAGKAVPAEIRNHASVQTSSAALPQRPGTKASAPINPMTVQGSGARAAARPAFMNTPILAPHSVPKRTPVVPTSKLVDADVNPGFGYVIKRIFAYLGDSILQMGACWLALSAALSQQGIAQSVLEEPSQLLFVFGFLLIFNWAIMTALEVAFGTTVFKRIFGLSLQGTASAIFLRAFFFVPGVAFAGAGLLWCLFNRQRRCWHDTVVDLAPTETTRL